MKKENENKPIVKVGTVETHIDQQEDRQKLIQQLLQLPDVKIAEGFSDAAFDREHLKIQLRNGTWTSPYEFDLLVQKTISKIIQPYEPRYPQVYYKQMLRLNGMPVPEGKVVEKPAVFALFTNELIYMRLSKEILQLLQRLNPLVKEAAVR
ncbi:MAG TPA: P63C domain-containing protein, partial [Flavobacteriales bacterium]